jgi:NADPH:quinone reductase-like Zn-dependent oxidoreductase
MLSHIVYRLQQRGSHHNLKRLSEPKPIISKHEVLVKIHAISLNYRDLGLGVADGSYPFPVKDKVVPCSDGAGEVVEVGASVEGLEIGDRVITVFDGSNLYGPQSDWQHGHGGPVDGVLREYIALPRTSVVKIPKNGKLSFSQMAALVCTGTTAWNVLYGNLPLRPGQTVLFQGECGPPLYLRRKIH